MLQTPCASDATCFFRCPKPSLKTYLDDQCQIFFVRQFGLFAQPEAVVDGEPVNGDGQVLGVDLGELLAAWEEKPPNKFILAMEIEWEL